MMFPIKDIIAYGYRFMQKTWYTLHHLGLDIIAMIGTCIQSPEAMTIHAIGKTSVLGNYVVGRGHVSGNWHRFLHGKDGSIAVSLKQNIKLGDKLMEVGNTGWSTAPHLHWDICKGHHSLKEVLTAKVPIKDYIDPMTFHIPIKDNDMIKTYYYITKGQPGLSRYPKKSTVRVNPNRKILNVMQITKPSFKNRFNSRGTLTEVATNKDLTPKENWIDAGQFHGLAEKNGWKPAKLSRVMGY